MQPRSTPALPRPAPTRRPSPPATGRCALCDSRQPLTFHHLIPRRNHHKPWFRDTFGLVEMRQRGAWLCTACHRFIHDQFDEGTLGRRLNTVEALRSEPLVERHCAWAGKRR